VGYASSTDGIWYTKYAGNPVLQSGIIGFDDLGILDVSVLLDRGYLSGHYRMWFTGATQGTQFPAYRIGTADSGWGHPEGPWTKYFAPVLDMGESGSWDGFGVSGPTVLWDERARIYRMWYTGFDGWEYRIGYAVSADGYGWTKYPVPVLSDAFPSLFDAPTVVKIGDFFWMWYHDGKVGYIRCAYSGDGIWWTDWGKPVLKPGIVWDYVSSYVSEPMVFTRDLKTPLWQDSQRLKMFYVADEYGKEKIGYAYTYFGMATLPLFMDTMYHQTYFINADPSRSQYTAYDSLSSGILYGLCLTGDQYQGFDTNPNWVMQFPIYDLDCQCWDFSQIGSLLLRGKWVVTMGGRAVNSIVNYYEVSLARTPIYVNINTATQTYEFVNRLSGTVAASMPFSTDFAHNDLAVIMQLTGDKNEIMIIYGITWRGTWAGGIYFKNVIWKGWYAQDMVGYNYVIVRWTDSDNDGAPHPFNPAEIVPVTYGFG